MCAGRALLNLDVPKPLRVGLISLEDKRNTVEKRVAAAMKLHHLTPEDIGGRLFLKGKGEIKGFKIDKPEFRKALVEWIKQNQLDVVSIDPFVRTHTAPENDNVKIQQVIELYESVAEECDCAISLWHHTRKPKDSDSGASEDNARGASSFVDACRSVRAIDNMSVKEANGFKITERRQYFKSYSGKLNYAPTSEKCEWYHIENIDLMNAPHGGLGDSVGAVEAWKPYATVQAATDEEKADIVAKLIGQLA
jgi:hypothetical protein